MGGEAPLLASRVASAASASAFVAKNAKSATYQRERDDSELITSDRELEAFREGSK